MEVISLLKRSFVEIRFSTHKTRSQDYLLTALLKSNQKSEERKNVKVTGRKIQKKRTSCNFK